MTKEIPFELSELFNNPLVQSLRTTFEADFVFCDPNSRNVFVGHRERVMKEGPKVQEVAQDERSSEVQDEE